MSLANYFGTTNDTHSNYGIFNAPFLFIEFHASYLNFLSLTKFACSKTILLSHARINEQLDGRSCCHIVVTTKAILEI